MKGMMTSFSKEGQEDTVRECMQHLQNGKAALVEEDFRNDVNIVADMCLVKTLSDEAVGVVVENKRRLDSGQLVSRFYRLFRRFPTGLKLLADVEAEMIIIKDEDGLTQDHEHLQSLVKEVPLPITYANSDSVVCYMTIQKPVVDKLVEIHSKHTSIVGRMSPRFGRKHKEPVAVVKPVTLPRKLACSTRACFDSWFCWFLLCLASGSCHTDGTSMLRICLCQCRRQGSNPIVAVCESRVGKFRGVMSGVATSREFRGIAGWHPQSTRWACQFRH